MEHVKLVCDFVNSVDLEQERDELADGAGLARWLEARGLAGARATGAEAARARELRESLRELLRANAGLDADVGAAAAVLDEAAQRAGVVARFAGGSLRLAAPEGGIGAVVAAVGQAMADGSWARVKACRSDTCRWAFVDGSRNGSRRWCSMSVCGNREKARVFRSRHA